MNSKNLIQSAIIVFILVSLTSFSSLAQAPSWSWARGSRSPLGYSHAYGVGITTDRFGNVYEIGTFESSTLVLGGDTLHNSGIANLYLAKYSRARELVMGTMPFGYKI
jgi:hypothetical protein